MRLENFSLSSGIQPTAAKSRPSANSPHSESPSSESSDRDRSGSSADAIVRRLEDVAFEIQSRIIEIRDGSEDSFVVKDATLDPQTGEPVRQRGRGGNLIR